MTDHDEQDRLVRLLAPEHRLAEQTRRPDGPAAEELLNTITTMARTTASTTGVDITGPAPAGGASRPTSWFGRRRLAFAVPTLAALGALAAVVAVNLPSGPADPGPAQVAPSGAASGTPGGQPSPAPSLRPVGRALSIVPETDHIVVTIVDPTADPARYQAELEKHGLDIEITVAPVPAERVGRVVFMETGPDAEVETIESPGNCTANGNCSVGVRIPLDFRSYARIVFGRAPLPGEQPLTEEG
ncbi:hypothetical protein O7626_28400 [Micromonospora sp. WMMD1102]|uniref:hypothetical protein n=1 Tax=Micromonospora sp. WMMD1102 TaxID=3016105 RepID=UPI0024152D5E|nr:hypothetical protein [Micromonospora sp. WMMD1102]MDG4789801.1 hypothetical protein [Micromonospora sp. WMMD1102]